MTAPAGKEFDGWKAGGTTYARGDSYTVKGNVVFTAQWKDTAPQSFTVTFDSDGGTPAQTPKTVANSGGTVGALPTAPTKTGYAFDNWHTEKNGGGSRFTAATPVPADITVYANWKVENPLIGAWVDDPAYPSELEIFTAEYHFRVSGSLNWEPTYDSINNEHELRLSVSGTTKTYAIVLSNNDNSLTVKGYTAGGKPAEDVTFTRILDSSKAGAYGAWHTASGFSSEDYENTLLVIPANGKVLSSFDRDASAYDALGNSNNDDATGGNWVRWRYSIVVDMIRWPDTPNLSNRFTISDGKLSVAWSGSSETVYTKLEL
jgi:uncharacterized repeat protein (TIGR02543 family)